MSSMNKTIITVVILCIVLFFVHQGEEQRAVIAELRENNSSLQSEVVRLKNLPPKIVKAQSIGFSYEDADLLARLVHAEARGESYDTKLKVASVVINRLNDYRFPKTLSEVIYQKNQFAVTFIESNGRKMIDAPADEFSRRAAFEVLSKGSVLPEDVLMFYGQGVDEECVEGLEIYLAQDNTTFCYF